MRDAILIVDDIETNRIILENILQGTYDVYQAVSGIDAAAQMLSGEVAPAVVLLDIMMPEMDGYEVLELMKSNRDTADIPVLFITAADSETNESKGITLGAVDYISKPFNPEVVRARVKNHLMLRKYNKSFDEMVNTRIYELIRTKDKILETMADIIEYRDVESGNHIRRTCDLTGAMINYLYKHSFERRVIAGPERDMAVKAVPLHDVGKISVPDNILLKPGPLTQDEFSIVKTHATAGSEIIRKMLDEDSTRFAAYCYDICRYHHERWDGLGYPDGLSGESIPLAARILAVVDVYDALVSTRIYKAPVTHEEAVDIIRNGAGTQFDPVIAMALLEMHEQFRKIHLSYN